VILGLRARSRSCLRAVRPLRLDDREPLGDLDQPLRTPHSEQNGSE
jgi:hypothetical protein